MTREIKFSYIFQHGETGAWTELKHTLENIEIGAKPLLSVWNLVARRQFTGLKDKNGVEIYEGDIVAQDGDALGGVGFHVINGCWEIWSNPEREDVGWSCPLSAKIEYIEVIGNIHENPELLDL